MEAAPNRAENPNRKVGDHETPLIHLTEGMRPYGTMIHIQEMDPRTGAYGEKKPMGTYETGTVDHVHALLESMKNLHKGTGNIIHAEVTYHPDDIAAQREKTAETIGKQINENPLMRSMFSESGLNRQLNINQLASQRVPTKAGTSFKESWNTFKA
jgi:hypothetical protein